MTVSHSTRLAKQRQGFVCRSPLFDIVIRSITWYHKYKSLRTLLSKCYSAQNKKVHGPNSCEFFDHSQELQPNARSGYSDSKSNNEIDKT